MELIRIFTYPLMLPGGLIRVSPFRSANCRACSLATGWSSIFSSRWWVVLGSHGMVDNLICLKSWVEVVLVIDLSFMHQRRAAVVRAADYREICQKTTRPTHYLHVSLSASIVYKGVSVIRELLQLGGGSLSSHCKVSKVS